MYYHIDYELDGVVKREVFDGHDVGNAYKKCLKKYPEAKLVSGHLYRKWAGGEMWMSYEPASAKSPEPLPSETRIQSEMQLGDPRKPSNRRLRAGK